MRLNDGGPVWHVSVSIWKQVGRERRLVSIPKIAEKASVKVLRGVGNQREWWLWNDEVKVGHLRVGLTTEEISDLSCGLAVHDAGPAGPERVRTR